MLVLLMTAVTGAWADTTVTWEGTTLQGIAVSKGYGTGVTTESMTVDGITITANTGYLLKNDEEGVKLNSGAANGVVFSAENNIKSITITSTGFSKFTPDGGFQPNGGSHTYEVSPAATSYGFANGVKIVGITKIEITLEGAPAPAGYTVSMPQDTPDAGKWTARAGTDGTYQQLPLEGVAQGAQVSLKYEGALKVKSVRAKKAAPANVPVTSITLNKTATEITVGQTETLSVTEVLPAEATDKTYTWKSGDETKATVDQNGVVTAKAEGTVNIYAEANDGSEVKGTCAVTVKAAAPATITVTWNYDDITGDDDTFTKDGVTITADYIDFDDKNFYGPGTFTTTLGNFTKIEVTTGMWDASGTGWSGSEQSGTWTGNASSVSFSGDIWGMGGMEGDTKFVFTIEPTN